MEGEYGASFSNEQPPETGQGQAQTYNADAERLTATMIASGNSFAQKEQVHGAASNELAPGQAEASLQEENQQTIPVVATQSDENKRKRDPTNNTGDKHGGVAEKRRKPQVPGNVQEAATSVNPLQQQAMGAPMGGSFMGTSTVLPRIQPPVTNVTANDRAANPATILCFYPSLGAPQFVPQTNTMTPSLAVPYSSLQQVSPMPQALAAPATTTAPSVSATTQEEKNDSVQNATAMGQSLSTTPVPTTASLQHPIPMSVLAPGQQLPIPVVGDPRMMQFGVTTAGMPLYMLSGNAWQQQQQQQLANTAALHQQQMLRNSTPAAMPVVGGPPPQQQQQQPAAVGNHVLGGRINHGPQQAGLGAVIQQSPGMCMYLPSDDEHLSDYQILVRKQIEFFAATRDDVATNIQGRKKQIFVGQVGLRCRHCCTALPLLKRGKGSVYFPMKLSGLYQAAQNMATTHLTSGCVVMDASIQAELVRLRQFRVTASGGKRYWADAARALGVCETEQGLRLSRG